MKKLVLSLALVLGATFAFGQELTKEQLKEQKKQIKALMKVAETAEANINAGIAAAKQIVDFLQTVSPILLQTYSSLS